MTSLWEVMKISVEKGKLDLLPWRQHELNLVITGCTWVWKVHAKRQVQKTGNTTFNDAYNIMSTTIFFISQLCLVISLFLSSRLKTKIYFFIKSEKRISFEIPRLWGRKIETQENWIWGFKTEIFSRKILADIHACSATMQCEDYRKKSGHSVVTDLRVWGTSRQSRSLRSPVSL